MYSYSNKIRFIGIILYLTISVDSIRAVFWFHILKNDNSSYRKSGIREGKSFEITRWVQWENNLCKHWINLKYCAEIYVVRLGDHFLCITTVELSFPHTVHFRLHSCKRHNMFKKLKKLYSYSNKIRFIGIIFKIKIIPCKRK
jgi:hypothetical protein